MKITMITKEQLDEMVASGEVIKTAEGFRHTKTGAVLFKYGMPDTLLGKTITAEKHSSAKYPYVAEYFIPSFIIAKEEEE